MEHLSLNNWRNADGIERVTTELKRTISAAVVFRLDSAGWRTEIRWGRTVVVVARRKALLGQQFVCTMPVHGRRELRIPDSVTT